MAATAIITRPENDKFRPEIPHSIEETHVSGQVLYDLFVRRLYVDGTSSISAMSKSLRLSLAVIDRIFRHFRDERVLEVRGADNGEDYTFTLTHAGQRLAASRMRVTQYVGPAPVCLRDYTVGTRAQAPSVTVNPAAVHRALGDLVVSNGLIHTLGPALAAQRSLFLYGPTGNGKTAIAERLHRVYHDTVFIPHAVEVDGHIIVVHDPVLHRQFHPQPQDVDHRWVLCERPFVMVGGELTADMLELRLDDSSRTYAAPIQMKANTGMLVIDDFGRQVMTPRRLLNRWVLPIDRRIDYLSLRYGMKFEIPFELMLVFSTNLDPSHLADEAFLRRLPNKVYIGPVTPDAFDEIFRREAAISSLECSPDMAREVRELCRGAGQRMLRACVPADLCSMVASMRRFEGTDGRTPLEYFSRAVALYFAKPEAFQDSEPAPHSESSFEEEVGKR